MMVVTAKVNKRNILIVIAAIIAILAVLFIPGKKAETTVAQVTDKAETNEQRVAFLNSLGWEVNEAPVETQEVMIPAEANEVYERYNELQKSQGYDLDDYAGKSVKRYVYEITNYPDAAGSYRATLLVHKGRVIGGDVASTDAGGVMHSLQQPT